WPLVLPLAALALFSFVQTLPIGHPAGNPAGISFAPWNAISADPYQTRFFALQLLALTLSGLMLARYASSKKRLRIVINLVILLAVATAIFGILRQTTQQGVGFGLTILPRDVGYGQFINKNHFRSLIEMGIGLILGLILGGGVKREQSLIYFAALLPIWIGLVLCNSRGGLIAMLCQVVIAALLFSAVLQSGQSRGSQSKVLGLSQFWPVRIVLILVLVAG